MVQSLNTSLNSSIYRFDAFILAASAAEDGSSQTLQALPKAAVQDRDAEPVPYTVTKLWKGDASHPASVDIDIYRDGNLFETVTLSSANNWTYSWTDDGASRWSVMEKAIPENYDLELTRNGQNYLVTNTYDTVTDEPKEESPNTPSSNDKNPGGNKSGGSKTGLTEHENEFIVLAGAAGLILLVLGLRMKKTKQ
jgi:hypothetical protein